MNARFDWAASDMKFGKQAGFFVWQEIVKNLFNLYATGCLVSLFRHRERDVLHGVVNPFRTGLNVAAERILFKAKCQWFNVRSKVFSVNFHILEMLTNPVYLLYIYDVYYSYWVSLQWHNCLVELYSCFFCWLYWKFYLGTHLSGMD